MHDFIFSLFHSEVIKIPRPDKMTATLEGTPRTCTEDLTLPESSSTGTDTSMLNRRHQLARLLRIDSRKVVHRSSSVLRPYHRSRTMLPRKISTAEHDPRSAEGAVQWFLPFP